MCDYETELARSASSTLEAARQARDATGRQYWRRPGDLRRIVAGLPRIRQRLLGQQPIVIHGDMHPGNVGHRLVAAFTRLLGTGGAASSRHVDAHLSRCAPHASAVHVCAARGLLAGVGQQRPVRSDSISPRRPVGPSQAGTGSLQLESCAGVVAANRPARGRSPQYQSGWSKVRTVPGRPFDHGRPQRA